MIARVATALPMLAASLLATEGQTVLHRVPPVKDVLVAMEVLRRLGAKVDYDIRAETAVIDACDIEEFRLPEELTSRFRASLLFIGPLLGRFRRAWISEVGGCTIGSRPTDYHYRGFARLGARLSLAFGPWIWQWWFALPLGPCPCVLGACASSQLETPENH